MRNAGSLSFIGMLMVALLGVVSCAPSAPQLKKVIEDNPDILYAAMRKDPTKFLEVVNEIAEAARTQKESEQFEEGFKNRQKADIDENRPFEGPANAAVTIVEYSDFQCPVCGDGHMAMKEILKTYEGKVRITMKNYPIDRLHPQARKMALLYEAMVLSDKAKAIEFKNYLFEHQDEFTPIDSEKSVKTQEEFMAKYNKRIDSVLAKVVKKFGFEFAALKKTGEGEAVKKTLEADAAEAQRLGITGTPGYLINGVPVRGLVPPEAFKSIIDRLLAEKK